MFNTLKNLCLLNSASGDEWTVRDYIIEQIKGYADIKIDNLGNIIAFKKGKNAPAKKLMIDAYIDEVGIIVSAITADGFLKFQTVGGIKDSVLLSRRVNFINVSGVIGCKPVHLTTADESKKVPKAENMYIDIGASTRSQAEELITLGDYGVLDGDYCLLGENKILSKALDDRIGCALLIELLKKDSLYDFYATFTVLEEVGARGAKVASYSVEPDFALVLEATTAADIFGVAEEKTVCKLGGGVAVSFMDNGTVYDKSLYNAALNSGLKCQVKSAVAGGNNSSSIHLSKSGVRTLALSVPCRYIHSPSCLCDKGDINSALDMIYYLLDLICGDKID